MKQLYIDIGSTYFKVCEAGNIEQHFRNFERNIFDDLRSKCGETIARYAPEAIQICSSANGGLSTLIIGRTYTFSLKYATNIAYNSGINIIDSVLYSKIEQHTPPLGMIDVVIIAGGIDDSANSYDMRLIDYLKKVRYHNIVYAGSAAAAEFMTTHIENVRVMQNIISDKLQLRDEALKNYLTHLYQEDIMGKEEIKSLYALTANHIYPTPYIVNQAMQRIPEYFPVVDPFILVDIGGATTDIHYSRDLIMDNLVSENPYDRLVFKKLGVYKSRENLVFTARNNEYVYELLAYLGVTENILDEKSDKATRILMQLSIFLVLYKVSLHHNRYVNLYLEKLNSIVLTGGITKVLSLEECEQIVGFFYKKLLHFHQIPTIIMDSDYMIWTMSMKESSHVG